MPRPCLLTNDGTDATIAIGDQHVVIDAADVDLVLARRWSAIKNRCGTYYFTCALPGRRTAYLHKVLGRVPDGMLGDHRDGDTHNNRRANIRAAFGALNNANMKKASDKGSRYKGVWRDHNSWCTELRLNGRRVFRHNCTSELRAALIYDIIARLLFGEFACVNFPRPGERGALSEAV